MIHLSVTKRYDVPRDAMWERIGDPAKLADWHPYIERSEMLDETTRVNTTADGALVRETIVERSDASCTWRIDESPLPVEGLFATLRVHDDGVNACVVEFDSTFEPRGVTEAEASELNRNFYQAGLDALSTTEASAR